MQPRLAFKMSSPCLCLWSAGISCLKFPFSLHWSNSALFSFQVPLSHASSQGEKKTHKLKTTCTRAAEMVQQFRAFVALTEDQRLLPSTHMVAINPQPPLSRLLTLLFWPLQGQHTKIQGKHPIHTIKIINLLKRLYIVE